MIDFEVREDFSSIENISQDIVTGVEKRDEPGSWMELARQYGCKEAELGKFLEKTVRKVLDYCSKNAGTYDNGLWPGIEVIYRFWLVNSKERARFGSDLESFDAFWKKYGRRYGVEVKKNLCVGYIAPFLCRLYSKYLI